MKRSPVVRATALLMSWIVPATSVWAAAPLPAALTPAPLEPAAPPPEPMLLHGGGDEKTVRPILECVRKNGHDSYTAFFGYKNEKSSAVTIPVGEKNAFFPGSDSRGQTTVFQPGRSPYYPNAAFNVSFSGLLLVWSLKGPDGFTRTAIATPFSPRCEGPAPQPTPTPTPVPTPTPTPTPPPSQACEVPIYGPKRFDRTNGQKDVYTKTFTVPSSASAPFTMKVVNGQANGQNRVSSAWIEVNGTQVASPSDFSQQVAGFTRNVSLLPQTTLKVTLASSPCSYITINFCGSRGDHQAPTLTWSEPAANAWTNDATPRLAVRYQDASGVDTNSLKVTLDDVDVSSLFTRRSDEASAELSEQLALQEGEHELHAEVKDAAGNLGQADTTFRLDLTPPTLAVAEPAAGTYLGSAAARVRIAYGDAGALPSGADPATLRVLVNGQDRTAQFARSASEASADLSGLASGVNQVVATIRDRAGNERTAAGSFNVDTQPPTLRIDAPPSGTPLGSSLVDVEIPYADDQALDLATFTATLDGQPISLTTLAHSAIGRVGPLSDGPHTLAASVKDRAGNPASASRSFSVDTSVPPLFVLQPIAGAKLNSASPLVEIDFHEAQDADPQTLRVRVDGIDRTALFTVASGRALGTLAGSAALADGAHEVEAELADGAGNRATARAAFSVDTHAPTALLQQPAPGTFTGAAMPAIAVAYADACVDASGAACPASGVDPAGVRLFVDGVEAEGVSRTESGATWTPPAPLADGEHVVRVELLDRAGNAGVGEGRFSVDTLAPTAAFEAPRPDSFVNDTTPELRLRFLDVGRDVDGGPAPPAGVDAASVRVFLRSGGDAAPEVELEAGLERLADVVRGELPGPLGEGTHRLRAVVTDRAGNARELVAAFEVDVTAPAFHVEAPPANGYVATTTPALLVRYSDDRSGVDPDLLRLLVDGVDRSARLTLREAEACSEAGPASCGRASGELLPEDALAQGAHTLLVTVVDRAGNAAAAAPHAFTVDTLAPTASVVAPANGAYLGASPAPIRFAYQDTGDAATGIDAASVRAYVDGVDRTAEFTVSELQAERGAAFSLADGPHTLKVEAYDWAGNRAEASASFMLDTQPPSVGSISVNDGSYYRDPSGNLVISGTVQDMDPGVTLFCRVGGAQSAATIANGQWSCTVPLTEGQNEIEIVASDRNSYSTANERNVTYDTTAPQLEIQQPPPGTYTNALQMTVVGLVLDASPVTVELSNGAATFPCTVGPPGPAPVTFTCPGVVLGDGPDVTLRATATDAAGNPGTAQAALRVDRADPQVTITAPGPGAYVPGVLVEVRGTVADESPVTVDVNGVPATVTESAGIRTFVATAAVDNGLLRATARDAASNVGTAEVGVNVDTAPPVIGVTSPAPSFVTSAGSATIAGSVEDASPVTLTASGPGAIACVPTSFAAGGGSFTCNATLPPTDGAAVYVLRATDAAGNVATRNVTIRVDRSAPQLSIVAPGENAPLLALPVIVQGLVSDASAVNVTVDGVPASVIEGAWQIAVGGLADGRHTFHVVATDEAGNVSSAERGVFVELNAPDVTIAAPPNAQLTNAAETAVSGSVTAWTLASVKVGSVEATFQPSGTASDGRSVFSFTAAAVPLAEGDNTLVAAALTQSGRPGQASVLVTSDRTPPTLELAAPANVIRGQPAQAVASAGDTRGLASITIVANGVGVAECAVTGTAATCTAPLEAPAGVPSGETFLVQATARDAAGNQTPVSRAVRVLSEGIVVGQVLSDQTGLPLPGASVTALGGQGASALSLTTDERGRYSLPTTQLGLVLVAEREGFTSVERDVAIQAAVGNLPVDARLTPLAKARLVGVGGGSLPASSELPAHVATAPGAARAVALAVSVPPQAVALETPFHLTPLTSQGLPALLPLGWSPLAAFDLRVSGAAASPVGELPATLTLPAALAGAVVHLVKYQPGFHGWQMLARTLQVPPSGPLGFGLPGPGAYAVVTTDPGEPSVPVAEADALLEGVAPVLVPGTSTSRSLVTPPTLPPSGGTAVGQLAVASPAALPSGSIVQAEVTETFSLASGQTASEEKRRVDIVLYRGNGAGTPPAEGFQCAAAELCAEFPITPSRTFQTTELVLGTVQMDVFAGRSAVRGQAGGSDAVAVEAGVARLVLPAGALAEDTAVSLESALLSEFVPNSGGLTPLGEVVVDLAGKTLQLPAQLSLQVLADPADTLLLARVERVEGVPRLAVVALAEVSGDRVVTKPFAGLPGVLAGGRYVFFRSNPVGLVFGTTSSSAGPVKSLVSTDSLPFVGFARLDGYYVVAAAPGSVSLEARVPGTSLAGTAQADVAANATFNLDIALAGTVTQATVTPPNDATGIATNVQVEIQTTAPLRRDTAVAANVKLFKGPPADDVTVAARLLLSSSGQLLALIPSQALQFSTDYTLQASGLVDTFGQLVVVPATKFRTRDDVKPFYDPHRLVFGYPSADGIVTVKAPGCWPDPGCFYPGTTVLIVNSGNGSVLSVTAGNNGEIDDELQAGVNDLLLVTITDPFGNQTNFQRSEYVAPDGKTAVGIAGGLVRASDGSGVELRIPEGALDQAVTLKISGFASSSMPYPAAQKPAIPDGFFGTGLTIQADRETHFKKEVDLAFPLPNFADAPADKRPPKPEDAFFHVYRRLEGPNGAVMFEVIDVAKVECPNGAATCADADKKVVTASYPFTGYRDGWSSWDPTGGGEFRGLAGGVGGSAIGNVGASIAIMFWTHNALLPGAPVMGVITGRVLRAKTLPGGGTEYEGVPNVRVERTDIVDPQATMAITREDGRYVIFDPHFTGGLKEMRALVPGSSTPYTALAFALQKNDSKIQTDPQLLPLSGMFHNLAYANILVPATEIPPPAPDIRIRVMRTVNGQRQDTGGLVIAGTPLVVGFKVADTRNGEVSRAHVNGQERTLTVDPLKLSQPLSPFAMDKVFQDEIVPTVPGNYTVTATALPPFGPPVTSTFSFRVIAEGGNTITAAAGRPAVLSVTPANGATGLSTDVFVEIRLSEPVKNVTPATVRLLEDNLPVDVKISAVAVDGGVEQPVDDLNDPERYVTSLTLQPRNALKFGSTYVLTLSDALVDMDQPFPSQLQPWQSAFSTFEPVPLGGSAEPTSEKPRAAGMVVFGDRGYLLETQHGGGIGGPLQSGQIRTYDLQDPIEPREIPAGSPEAWRAFVNFPPRDMAGEERLLAGADPTEPGRVERTLAVVAAPRSYFFMQGEIVFWTEIRSSPSNLFLYDVSEDGAPVWVGAASLAQNLDDGIPSRVVVKDGFAYVASYGKGLQVVDLNMARSGFPIEGAQVFTVSRALSNDGMNQAAVVNTITLTEPPNPPPNSFPLRLPMVDLKVQDMVVGGVSRRAILATGPRKQVGLVVADPASPQPLWRGELSSDLGRLDFGYAIALAQSGARPLALVGGYGVSATSGSGPVLVVVDLSPLAANPIGNPTILSVLRLDHSIGDILVTGQTAIVSADRGTLDPRTGQEGLATFVDLSAPESPKALGNLAGVASRMVLGENGILYSTERSVIKGLPNELGGIRTASLQPNCNSFDLRTPVVTIDLMIDPLNQTTCGSGGAVVFAVCQASLMTLKVDGVVAQAGLDGGPQQPIASVLVPPGVHALELPAGIIGFNPSERKPFTLDAADPNDTSQVQSRAGDVVNEVENRSVLPVGRTFVKGVDVFDGHVVQQSTDLKIQGRHLGIEVTRTYSSSAVSRDDVAGAGWSWNYDSRLTPSSCGLYNVSTADGSSQTFRSTDNGQTFTPQKGYHTKLERRQDGSFDFIDKAGNVHHFKDLLDARRPNGPRRLDYIEEPHGDRIAVAYDVAGRVKEVAEVQRGGAKPRAISVTYEMKAGFDRISRIQSSLGNLKYQVDYKYDSFGNLLQAIRAAGGLTGDLPSVARTETYDYDRSFLGDPHQLTAVIDPNSSLGGGHRIEYEYYKETDPSFPGTVNLLGKREFAKEVRELTGTATHTTGFAYDFTEVTQLRWQTTVTDARQNPTLYVLNGNGSPLEIQEPLGKTTKMKWASADIFKEEEEDAKGRKTKFFYDSRANLTREEIYDPNGELLSETRYEYDELYNKLKLKVDPEGHRTEHQINPANGDLLSTKDAAGNVTRYEYDGGALDGPGLLTGVTSPRGFKTVHTAFDSFNYGNPTSITDPLGNVTTRGYDARGRLVGEEDTLGHKTLTVYDAHDRPRKVTRFAGGQSENDVTETEYYAGGETKSIKNGKGTTTTFGIDGLNRVVSTTTGPVPGGPLTTSIGYDGNGNKELETDRRGVTRKSTFDALNRVKQVEITAGPAPAPMGVVAAFDYDVVGNKLYETDVAGLRTDFEYDGLYRVKLKRLAEAGPSGRYVEVYGYDKVGNRTSLTDAAGKVTTFEFDGLQRVTKTTRDPGGLNLVQTTDYLDAQGARLNKTVEQDQATGLRVQYTYDALNRELTRTQFLSGPTGNEQYLTGTGYDDRAHTVTVTDPRQVKTVRRLDGLDQVVEETLDPNGLTLQSRTVYDAIGKPKLATDRNGKDTQFEHDGVGRLRRTIDALQKDTLFNYDGEGLKTAQTDRRGVTKTFSYDNLGRPTGSALVASISGVPWSQTTQHLDQNPPSRIEIDARGHATRFDLDRLYRVVKVTDPDGKVAITGWDGVDKRSQSDKRGNVTLFEYDNVHRLKKTTDPAPFSAQTVVMTYEDAANRETEVDRRGTSKVTQKDSLGRVRSVTRAGLILERHTYDGNGNRTSSIDAENKQTQFQYDAGNRLKTQTEGVGTPDAAITQYTYDGNGNKLKEIDPRSTAEAPSAEFKYDALNRTVESYNGLRHKTSFGYDPEGNRVRVTEPLGQETTFAYDELGKLTRVTQPAVNGVAPVTRHGYDPNRNRTFQEDAKQHVVSMSYDKLNRLENLVQEGGFTTHHEYDADGNERLLIDPKGQQVNSTYDELGRLKLKSYAFAEGDPASLWRHTTAVEYAYDPNGNLTEAKEFVASGNDPPATLITTKGYDLLDRLTSDAAPLPDGGSRTVGYTYYGNGTRKTVTDPEGRVTQYTYDGQNRLKTATTQFGTPQAATTNYEYFPDDLVKEVLSPNGVKATSGYDAADRLTSLVNAKGATAISSFTYGYDDNGNRLSQVEVNGGRNETTSYGYDNLNRLRTIGYPDKRVAYVHDAVGNRVQETEKDLQDNVTSDKHAAFDALNRLQSVTDHAKASDDPARLTSFTWDANGNQTTRTAAGVTTTYVYDVRDKLVEVQQGTGVLARFQYCYDGRRVKKIGAEGIRQYIYDDDSVLAEYDDAGLSVAKYDYGDRLISLTRRDEPRRYYSFDALGTVVNLTGDSGDIAGSFHIDAWGNYRFPAERSASHNDFGFTGHEFDEETGLYNARARYYDPTLGRFLSQDDYLGESEDPPSLHRYFYGHGNPTFYVDPSGHDAQAVWHSFKENAKWTKDFIVAFGTDLAQNAPERAGKVAEATWRNGVNMVKETGANIHDAVVLGYEVTTGRDSGVQLRSSVAHQSVERMARGESAADITKDILKDNAVNLATFGIYGTAKEQYGALRDFSQGKATIEDVENRLADAAGGAIVNTALSAALFKKATGSAWGPDIPGMGKVPGPKVVVESLSQLPSKARAAVDNFLPQRGSIEAAKIKGKIGESLTVAERFLRGEKIVGRQTTFEAGGARARFDFVTQNRFTGKLKVVESKFGLSAQLERGQPIVADVLRNTGNATVRGRGGVQTFRGLGFKGGSYRRGLGVNGLEFVEQRFPLLERAFDKLLF